VLKGIPVYLQICHTLLQISSFQGIRLSSITLVTYYKLVSNSERHFEEYLSRDTFKNKSRILLKVFKYLVALLCYITFYEQPKFNYESVTDRGV